MAFNQIEKVITGEVVSSVSQFLVLLQQQICEMIENEEGQTAFHEEKWQHQEGGGGITRVLDAGSVIEKAGVNFSHVRGRRLPPAATSRRPELADSPFQALGVSVVIHPLNPYVPTSHFNVRFIIVEREEQDPVWWFGGGFDLTPYYPFREDCQHWHRSAKAACDPFGENLYAIFKKKADDYFFLKHRNEPRGIGGIFYDDINEGGFEKCFALMQSVAKHFLEAYQPIIATRKNHPFGKRERDFQLYRRGRYVEFNLLYDRGTLFGLQSGGRTESILMSLPPLVAWHPAKQPESGTPEAKLYEEFLPHQDWV